MTPEFERLWQLGLGGIVAILLIREVLTYLKTLKSTRNGQKAAGDLTPEYWQTEQRKAITEVVVTVVVPILTSQATILAELKSSQQQTNIQIVRILTLIEERLVK